MAARKPPPGPSQIVPPKPQWGTANLPPRPFPVVPLPDIHIMPARCSACGARHHVRHRVPWPDAAPTVACPSCGRLGTMHPNTSHIPRL